MIYDMTVLGQQPFNLPGRLHIYIFVYDMCITCVAFMDIIQYHVIHAPAIH